MCHFKINKWNWIMNKVFAVFRYLISRRKEKQSKYIFFGILINFHIGVFFNMDFVFCCFNINFENSLFCIQIFYDVSYVFHFWSYFFFLSLRQKKRILNFWITPLLFSYDFILSSLDLRSLYKRIALTSSFCWERD